MTVRSSRLAGTATTVALACGLAGAADTAWQASVAAGDRVATTVSLTNHCYGAHRFRLDLAGADWLRWQATAEVAATPGETAHAPAEIDASGLDIGVYRGTVTATCLDCALEVGCRPNRQALALKVRWAPHALGSLDPDSFVPGRVLVTLTAAGREAAQRVAADIAANAAAAVLEVTHLALLDEWLVALSRPGNVPELVQAVQREPRVSAAQPDFAYEALATDPLDDLQHGARRLNLDRLAHRLTGGRGVMVALLDTGIDLQHPDLAGQVADTHDTSGAGYRAEPHGTSLAGVILARAENGIGIAGIAPAARLLAIQALVADPARAGRARGSSASVAKALDLAIGERARVVNLSFGGPRDPLIARLVRACVAAGAVVVAAAGNGGPDAPPALPAALPEAIAVTALDAQDRPWTHSQRGDYLSLAAPGVEILSTAPGGEYRTSSGTSLAAAHVTGLAALLLSERPALTPDQVRAALVAGARDLGVPGKDAVFGHGLPDACALPGVACVVRTGP